MGEPLTKSQRKLRGRKIADMTVEQLKDWIAACDKMERWIKKAANARRAWKLSGQEAQAELDRRIGESPKSDRRISQG